MILFFHVICLLARYFVSSISKSLSKNKVFSDDEDEDCFNNIPNYLQNKECVKHPIYKDGTLRFFPPVYVQRYETVALILKDPVWKKKINKVVDFGCSELGFFMYLKNTEGVTEILEVDIDSELLERSASKAAPLTCDYLMNKRDQPLDVYILAGNIADYDDYLIGTDAVVGIELIEHLSEEAFNNMPYNIFHKVKPKLAIFTTPNADFNSLFPNLKKLRHEDHKFEWTRKEFFNWTQEIIKLYPEYSARFYGIGPGPEGTENLGCCSQMVVFQRSDDTETFASARDKSEIIQNYKLIQHYKYPVYVDTRTREEKIVHEIQYQLAYFNSLPTYYNYENDENEVPLSLLKEYVADLCPDDDELQSILEKNGMILRKKNSSCFLVSVDTELEDVSDQRFKGEDWLNEEISENLDDDEDLFSDEGLLRTCDDDILPKKGTSLKSAKSLEELRKGITNQNEDFENPQKECIPIKKNKNKLPPSNCNNIIKQKNLTKEVCPNSYSDYNSYNNNENDNSFMKKKNGKVTIGNDGGIERTRSNQQDQNKIRSRIPYKKTENKKYFLEKNIGKTGILNTCQKACPSTST